MIKYLLMVQIFLIAADIWKKRLIEKYTNLKVPTFF